MSEDNKVDTEWVKSQMTAARTRRGAGDAVLKLLDVWNSLDLSPDIAKEAVETFSKLSLGYSLVSDEDNSVWIPAQAGQLSVGQTVRIKVDAFQGAVGTKMNGRVGHIVAIRTGRIAVKSSDGLSPDLNGDMFRAEQLDVKI